MRESAECSQAVLDYAVAHHLTPFISMQNDYNLFYREDEHEMLPTLKVCINRICDSLLDSLLQYLDVSFLPLTSLVHGAMTMPLDQQLALSSDNMCVSSSLPCVPIHLLAQVPRRMQGMAQYDHHQVTRWSSLLF